MFISKGCKSGHGSFGGKAHQLAEITRRSMHILEMQPPAAASSHCLCSW